MFFIDLIKIGNALSRALLEKEQTKKETKKMKTVLIRLMPYQNGFVVVGIR